MRSMEEQQAAHATYMTERVQSAIDAIATHHLSQPGAGEYLTLSDEYSFHDLSHLRVALSSRTLAATEPSGEMRTIDLGEFVAELTTHNYDQLRRLTRALRQRANGEPLSSGVGIEG